MIETISLIALASILLAGVITALLPCTYPMLIGYIALIIGEKESGTGHLLRVMWSFLAGFTLVYILFGSVAGLFGQFSREALIFNSGKPILLTLGALFFITVGLVMLDVIPLPRKMRGIQFIPLPKKISSRSWWRAFFIGTIFAAGWSPCIGPVLAAILVLAGTPGSVLIGASLMLLFALGMAVPFIILTLLYARASAYIQIIGTYTSVMRVAAGLLFILLGVSFMINDFSFLSTVQPFGFLGRYI